MNLVGNLNIRIISITKCVGTTICPSAQSSPLFLFYSAFQIYLVLEFVTLKSYFPVVPVG